MKFWKNVEKKTAELLPVQVFPAVVKGVNTDNRTCKVRISDNVDFEDVKLYAITDKNLKGFCLIPAVDSHVLVARIANGNDLYVAMFSEVDKVLGTIGKHTDLLLEEEHLRFKTEKVTVEVAKDTVTVDVNKDEAGIVLNGGSNNGLVKIAELTKKLNALVKSFNDHTHTFAIGAIAVEGTSAKQANAAAIISPGPDNPALDFDKKAYEDTKVKH